MSETEGPDRWALRDAVVQAALSHAAFDGWSLATLKAACLDAGISPADRRRLFPRGTKSLLDALDEWLDRSMIEACGADFDQLPVRKKIAHLVRSRFEPLEYSKESARRAVVARGWPTNMRAGGQSVWRTADRIWAKAGFESRSSDGISHYTRRATLVGILGAVCLFWMEDQSENSAESWRFLDKKIDGVLAFGKWKREAAGYARNMPGLRVLSALRRRSAATG